MKNFNKKSVVSVITLIISIGSFVLGLTGPIAVYAATDPNLGVASGYSVFGNAGITETAAQNSHLWGNVGDNGLGHASLIASQVDGTLFSIAQPSVVSAISTAYGELAGQAQTGAINLAASPTVGPGVYDVAATAFSSTLTLNGAGVYIFRSTSSIAQTAGGTMLLTNGASACNVYWQIPTDMTFAAVGNIAGTIITNTGKITLVSGVALQGRAWAHTQVTMDNNQITEPLCTTPTATPAPSGPNTGTINVVKTVINDNGGTKVVSDFPLFVNGQPAVSGQTYILPAPGPVFTVTETGDPNYVRSFSGDCDVSGQFNLIGGQNKFCIITNNDIGAPIAAPPVPPLIDVVKVPSPLALPGGPGPVTYTYTLRNIGTVPVTDVTMVGDTCSPIVLVSGDTNSDTKLDVNETWVHRCTTTLMATHTNTVVATGWANGISAVDVASSTVIVGAPVVPPLIHIVKKPSVLTLLSGGAIAYTFTVTNPGSVPLSNIIVTDNKCSPASSHSGDTNNDNLLDVSETWIYTCRTNLSSTTVNTAEAMGSANGLTATDLSVATVVVAVPPGLPKMGFFDEQNNAWNMLILAGILMLVSVSLFVALRRRTI